MPTEQDYREFLDYIAGRGPHALKGNGIWTYPNRDDPNAQAKYDACLELERRDLVYRAAEHQGDVLFEAVVVKPCPLCRAGIDTRYILKHIEYLHTDSIVLIYTMESNG